MFSHSIDRVINFFARVPERSRSPSPSTQHPQVTDSAASHEPVLSRADAEDVHVERSALESTRRQRVVVPGLSVHASENVILYLIVAAVLIVAIERHALDAAKLAEVLLALIRAGR